MKKNKVAAGLNGLLTPAPENRPTAAPTEQTQTVTITRPVSYNLNALLLEKIRYIAFVEHRKNNAVVSDALEQYVTEWEAANGKINVTL